VKAAAAEREKDARCVGRNVLQIALSLQLGQDLDPRTMRDCRYEVSFGTIESTTRDGWMIVAMSDMRVAFKTSKRHADGSFLRTTATATYLGLGTFNLVNGGTATIATFKLFE
jgi:hypothetical protein